MNLDFLNDSQRQAVLQTDGPVMILAGAGSGKTRTLVARIQYLLEVKNVSPYQILAVTFSNKAAREMRDRLSLSTGQNMGVLQVTTFHSFCAKILRNESAYLGLSKNFTIYDDSESQSIIKSILAQRGISLKEMSPYVVSEYIDEIKNLGFFPGATKTPEILKIAQDVLLWDIYLDYEKELHKSNAVDFGGLITGVLNLFLNFPATLEKYQHKFKYLLVDEYQDTNRAQFELITCLSKLTNNICVVGDEDQSIYSWRGADIRNILDFEKIYPESKIIKLEQNYRSSKKIIEAASEVISKNFDRKGKKMWTNNQEGDEILIVECKDDRGEAEFIAQKIREKIKEGVSLKDIAIFYRNNSQSRLIEDVLRREKFPYRVVAGIKFYDRKEIKDLISYMRVVVNKKDSLALSRIINTPARGIGATSLRKIEDEAVRLQLSLFEMLEKIVDEPADFKHLNLSGKVFSSLFHLVQLIHEVQIIESHKGAPSLSYEKLLNESGYLEFLKADKSYEGMARLENLDELMNAIKQYEDSEVEPSLVKFLENITLDTTTQDDQGSIEEISLMTIHGAKGLEYRYVFLIAVEENIFPSYKSLEMGPTALEEERRLFYVAMTRAMKELFISFSQARMLWGSLRFNGPSQFLYEIPEKYYKWIPFQTFSKKSESRGFNDYDFDQTNEYEDQFNQEKIYQRNSKVIGPKSTFSSGCKIKHALYGEGTVLDAEGAGPDEKVTIIFRDGVRKKFMVKFAPLERI